jgi:hypothetical protein
MTSPLISPCMFRRFAVELVLLMTWSWDKDLRFVSMSLTRQSSPAMTSSPPLLFPFPLLTIPPDVLDELTPGDRLISIECGMKIPHKPMCLLTSSHLLSLLLVLYPSLVDLLTLTSSDGYNASIIAYGQTGSGKTFTMVLPPPPSLSSSPAHR